MNTEEQVSPGEETQNPAPVTDESTPEVVTPETEATPEAEAGEPSESEESKALKRLQRRIDKRTADVYRERAEKEQLAQRLAQLEARDTPAEQDPPKDFEEAVRQRAREIAKVESVNAKCNAIAEEGKRLEGFTEAIKTLADEAPLFDRSGRPTALMEVVLEAEKPAVLLHHLGKNPDLAAELADLTPTQLARRLDRIERDLSAPPKTSRAPAPIEPLGSGKSPVVDLQSASMEDYMKLRAKQGASWARR